MNRQGVKDAKPEKAFRAPTTKSLVAALRVFGCSSVGRLRADLGTQTHVENEDLVLSPSKRC